MDVGMPPEGSVQETCSPREHSRLNLCSNDVLCFQHNVFVFMVTNFCSFSVWWLLQCMMSAASLLACNFLSAQL